MVLVEALTAAVLGLAALWLVLRPLMHPTAARRPTIFEPVEPEETAWGIALAALKEIEFDRETGKLSDADYELLKAKYTVTALEALRDDEAMSPAPAAASLLPSAPSAPVHAASSGATCPTCGPCPEPNALFCSNCGRPLLRRAAAH